jgi:hypothetical protein
MIATMKVPKAIEALDHHGQQGEQPTDQHAGWWLSLNYCLAVGALAGARKLSHYRTLLA